MNPDKYRKKPVDVWARHFTTNNETGDVEMNSIVTWINQGKTECGAWHNGTDIYIKTLEGEMRAQCGDWIVRGVEGEFYPVKPGIFEATYERVD